MFEKEILWMNEDESFKCIVLAEPMVGLTIKRVDTDEEVWCCHGTLSPDFQELRGMTKEESIEKFGIDIDGAIESLIKFFEQSGSSPNTLPVIYQDFFSSTLGNLFAPGKGDEGFSPSCALER